MTWINYEIFTQKWLERAKRINKCIDEGDKFISLWIAFNGWMKGKFGEDKRDCDLINKVKSLKDFKDAFEDLKREDCCFKDNLNELKRYSIVNMRYINNTNRERRYNGTFESLIEAIYQIRCNLFHGRKDIEEDKKDFKLVCLAYDILLPLFQKYIEKYGYGK